ncbi:TetR/AcrR family transcriptional regulator [Sporosarcina sp. Marseille-Q4943]|uniref:TetR/AcrR family transcriptional regulator n=1 Tax=Sporosarcina sp. Marseille-Q4943 TaxID=2942204 RepID=UPI00208DD315|nr:TetR/AcrR family transcriptional regulator [Sporosarcina sp. Marseille-Q4943]
MNLREQKAAHKKEAIMKAAISVFTEKGYGGASLEDVAQKLFMTKGAVYYYFKDKQDLLYQSQVYLLQKSNHLISEILDSKSATIEKMKKAIVQHTEYVINERSGFESMLNPESFLTIDQQNEILRLKNEYESKFDKLIEKGIKEGVFIQGNIKIVRNLLLGAMNWVMQWYSEGGKKSKAELSDMIAFYLLRMLLQNPDENYVKGGGDDEVQ